MTSSQGRCTEWNVPAMVNPLAGDSNHVFTGAERGKSTVVNEARSIEEIPRGVLYGLRDFCRFAVLCGLTPTIRGCMSSRSDSKLR